MGVRVVLADQSAGRIAQSALAQCRMLVLLGHGAAERPYLVRVLGEELARGDYRGLRGPGLVKRSKPTKLAKALLEAVRKLG